MELKYGFISVDDHVQEPPDLREAPFYELPEGRSDLDVPARDVKVHISQLPASRFQLGFQLPQTRAAQRFQRVLEAGCGIVESGCGMEPVSPCLSITGS